MCRLNIGVTYRMMQELELSISGAFTIPNQKGETGCWSWEREDGVGRISLWGQWPSVRDTASQSNPKEKEKGK